MYKRREEEKGRENRPIMQFKSKGCGMDMAQTLSMDPTPPWGHTRPALLWGQTFHGSSPAAWPSCIVLGAISETASGDEICIRCSGWPFYRLWRAWKQPLKHCYFCLCLDLSVETGWPGPCLLAHLTGASRRSNPHPHPHPHPDTLWRARGRMLVLENGRPSERCCVLTVAVDILVCVCQFWMLVRVWGTLFLVFSRMLIY